MWSKRNNVKSRARKWLRKTNRF